ncbi:hypothetical protein ACLOJK_025071 [Asimina triloba]
MGPWRQLQAVDGGVDVATKTRRRIVSVTSADASTGRDLGPGGARRKRVSDAFFPRVCYFPRLDWRA